ncbi:MAG: Rad52/Rad22 family DNA repair protein [Dehalococcoidia bacterium]
MADANGPRSPRPSSLSREAKRRLRQPLDDVLVAERTTDAGAVVRYLEGWRAIEQANALFGVDRWGAEVIGEVTYRPLPGGGRSRGATNGVYTATVRVTVDGCLPHSDVGVGTVVEHSAEGHGTAYKTAVTDALKRALRHFGDQFGNRLSAGPGECDLPEVSPPEELRRQVLTIAASAGSDETRTREWVAQRYGCPLEELDGQPLQHAVRALSQGLHRRHEQAQAA